MPFDLKIVESDLRAVKKGLKAVGVPEKLVNSISTRALRSGRRQTGRFRSNRESRWKLDPEDPQYGSEVDCKVILLCLYGQIMEFNGAPDLDPDTIAILKKYLGHEPQPGSFKDPLTLEKLRYKDLIDEVNNPKHGYSDFHLGHRDPTQSPKHTPDNVEWRSARSNLIQGNLTLREARMRFVEIVARYFELGEITIRDVDDQGQ